MGNLKNFPRTKTRGLLHLTVFFATLLLLCAAENQKTFAAESEQPIPSFAQIAPGLYRGGQPTRAGYEFLKSLGIKTVINFRDEEEFIAWGKHETDIYGMEYHSFPWTIYGKLQEDSAKNILKVLGDPQKRPLFMYCKRGVERTGLITALYYIHYAGLNPEEAYREAFRGYQIKWIWKPFVQQKFAYFKDKVRAD